MTTRLYEIALEKLENLSWVDVVEVYDSLGELVVAFEDKEESSGLDEINEILEPILGKPFKSKSWLQYSRMNLNKGLAYSRLVITTDPKMLY